MLMVLWTFILYSTWLVNVFADFWRTVDHTFNTYTASDKGQLKYGYWYGSLGWGYGYWYGYWYGSYDAGHMVSNSPTSPTTPPSGNDGGNWGWGWGWSYGWWGWGWGWGWGWSYGWWGWGWGWSYGWWGWGSLYVPTSTNVNTNNAGTTTVSLTSAKAVINAVKFTTPKFKKVIPLLNTLVEKEFDKAYFVTNKTVFKNLYTSYYSFLVALKNYEAKTITKAQLKVKAQPFLNAYTTYNTDFKKVVTIKQIYVKWIKVKNYVFKQCKIKKVLTLLDTLVKKELSKAKYTKSDIKKFYKDYNMFKLAVKYMKTVNSTLGKVYAKLYVRKMLEVIKK